MVTGDKVVLGDQPRVIRGPGRDRVSFYTSKRDGELTVVPSDAARLVEAGRLDERLFNVTALARDGFDDRHRSDLPLIVSGGFAASVVRELPALGGSSVLARKSELASLWRTGGFDRIWLNGKAHLVDDVSNAQIGVPAAWQAGFTGKGVKVADLDGGYDASHPDLKNVVATKDFTGSSIKDGYGHGTHTASTIAGSGAGSNGKYAGVAPDASLLIGKVCEDDGGCPEDAIIAGMQWAADQGASIVNMSLGGGPTDGKDPLSLALNKISAKSGALFVVAAGNAGAARKVGNPAAADLALAVGSVTKQDELSRFSSQGPRLVDDAIKPDIASPGSDIIAARAKGTSMGTPVNSLYTSANGTSMATPHVTGAAALLLQQHPSWKAPELKAALMNAASPLKDLTVYQQGAGRLDIGRAVSSPVRASAGSVNFGRFPWPHSTSPVTRKVTFFNSGSSASTLALKAPVALSASSVTVPAGGSASVDLSFTPKADGLLSDWLTATDGSLVVRVALGASVEPESYDVTVKRELRGEVDESWYGALVNVDTGVYNRLRFNEDGSKETLRLPKGRYDLIGFSESSTKGKRYATALVKPGIVVSSNTTVQADENTAKPVTVKAGKAKLDSYQASLVFGNDNLTYASSADTAFYATPTATQDRVLGFSFRPVLVDGTSVYNLVFGSKDRVPSSLAFSAGELAAVKATYYVQGATTTATRSDTGALPWDDSGLGYTDLPVKVPSTRTEYYTPGVTWKQQMSISDGTTAEFLTHVRKFERAGSFTNEWNRAPIGPIPDPVVREGNEITIDVALFAPGDVVSASEYDGVLNGAIKGTSELSRNGVVLGKSDTAGGGTFTATPGPLTLKTSATRSQKFSVLGSKVDATWTFNGSQLMFIRASGKVSSRGVAPSGAFPLTLRVGGNSGAVSGVELSVSYDDGKTWKTVPVTQSGDAYSAQLTHPAGNGFVGLRTSAADASGNSVRQTVLRAYQFGQ
ncbi:S8 family serine peptidase [Lentzea sp. NBRC 105346]|uniref:S8 family peptidase n=1 Tax=Lentzea sp. NBRC 105346 TaxID=3032205 RepID=UPI002554E456|nr:S8 family serine peptidase [Lentzea sp. NBRC 105346]